MHRFVVVLIITLASSPALAKGGWHCRNSVEVSCSATACEAAKTFTPKDIHIAEGKLEVCAYSGCWQGGARLRNFAGFAVIAAENLKFSTGSTKAAIAITIDPRDGIGTIKVEGYAEPLNCVKE